MIPLAFYYIRWHYSTALRDLYGIIGNFLWFFYEFFSIPLLFKTFFVPFHRLAEQPSKGFRPQAWAEAFVVTTLMRFVGALLRTVLILLGILFLVFTCVAGISLFVTWLLAPLLLVFLIISGFTLIIAG